MCKATALEQALTNSKNIIGDNTMLMSFQNGIGHEEIMQKIAGKEKVWEDQQLKPQVFKGLESFKITLAYRHGLENTMVVTVKELKI